MLNRRLPERVSPFVRSISSRAFNALTEVARSVRGMHGAGGLAVTHGGGGVTVWQRRRPLRRRHELTVQLMRIVDFNYDHGVAVGFLGFPVKAAGQDNPDPIPELLAIGVWCHPEPTLGRDLQTAVPAFPFADMTPGQPPGTGVRADIPCAQFLVGDELEWRALWPFIQTCIG